MAEDWINTLDYKEVSYNYHIIKSNMPNMAEGWINKIYYKEISNFYPIISTKKVEARIYKLGSSENGRSKVYDCLEFKVVSNCCYPN